MFFFGLGVELGLEFQTGMFSQRCMDLLDSEIDELFSTLSETNMAPENGWLEDYYFPFQKPYFQGLC